MYGSGHRSVHSDNIYPLYLQVRHPLLKGVGVFPQGLLLLQELGVPSFSSRLEEPIVVNVPQWLVERADDLLFSVPHVGVQIKLETPLTDREHRAAWRSEIWTPRVLTESCTLHSETDDEDHLSGIFSYSLMHNASSYRHEPPRGERDTSNCDLQWLLRYPNISLLYFLGFAQLVWCCLQKLIIELLWAGWQADACSSHLPSITSQPSTSWH